MTTRHPSRFAAANTADWPRIWLFTDERMAGCAIAAARALPPRSGIVFRHYATSQVERHRLFHALLHVARARRHVMLIGGGPIRGADGVHGSVRRGFHPGMHPLSLGVHDPREVELARRLGVALVFISPVFPTRSHDHSATLGRVGFARLASGFPGRCIALGGMDAARYRALRRDGAHGWGAIDALSEPPESGRVEARSPLRRDQNLTDQNLTDQNLKRVPT